jgi:hypothetical protein
VKYFLAILLSLSLYSPDVARLIAYADLVVDTVTENKINICDCQAIVDKDTSEKHEQHMVDIKTSWTYLAAQLFVLGDSPVHSVREYAIYHTPQLMQFNSSIFQPPRFMV